MTVTSQTIVLTLIAAFMAVPAFFMFNKMPEAWLQDYDFDPKADNVRWAKHRHFRRYLCRFVLLQ